MPHSQWLFFLKELDVTLAQVKVQFCSYFIHSFPNPCETTSSLSPYITLPLFESVFLIPIWHLYCKVVWSGPTIKTSPVSYLLQQGRNPHGPFYFNTSKSIAQRLCFAIYSTEMKAFILKKKKKDKNKKGGLFFQSHPTLLSPFPVQLPIILLINQKWWRGHTVRLDRGQSKKWN